MRAANLRSPRVAGRILSMMLLAGGFSIGCRSGDTPSAASPGGVARVTQEVEGSRVAAAAPLAAYTFTCRDGREFVLARISGDPEAVDLIVGDRRQRLAPVPTGSGARYAAGGTSVWTKGREARLELDGRVATCEEDRLRSILEDARARGVEFRALGNEPGWVWELMADRMVFIGAYGAQRVITPRSTAPSGSPPGAAVYVAVTEAHRLTVRMVPGPCVDTMGGRRFPSTVTVELDGRTYRGCGEALR